MTDAPDIHILLVDDDELVLAGLKRLLRPLQLPILQASTAEQAAQYLRSHPVGVIVCEPRDQRLATFLINAMVHHPTATRVILTGYPDMGSVLKAVNEEGGLAIVFNGNKFSLPYGTASVASTDLIDILPLVNIWLEKGG